MLCLLIAATPPPTPNGIPDNLWWNSTDDGRFSVRSAYNLLAYGASNPTEIAPKEIWSACWSLSVPQRLRTLLWQTCHNRLLTGDRLKKMKIQDHATCLLCGHFKEDILHVFRDCYFPKAIWMTFVPRTHWASFFSNNLAEWILNNLRRSHVSWHAYSWPRVFACTIYHLWQWRNKEKHDPIFSRPTCGTRIIEEYTSTVIDAWHLSTTKVSASKAPNVMQSWRPPEHNLIKLNVDASCTQSLHFVQLGGIFRNHNGAFLGGFRASSSPCSPLEAELLAIKLGLQQSIAHGFLSLQVESDSKSAVDLVKDSLSPPGKFGHHISEIRLSLGALETSSLRFIPREANRAADRMSRFQCTDSFFMTFLQDPPHELEEILLADCNGGNAINPYVLA